MGNTDSYVVWDVPGQPGSVLLNLDLVDALRRSFQGKARPKRRGIFGILLGRPSVTESHRALITIEDCYPVTDDQEDWRTDDTTLSPVGLVREDEAVVGQKEVLLVVRRVPKDAPVARLVWRGAHTEIPLDSARLKAGGFTILHGSGKAKEPARKPANTWRRWAWVPLVAGMAVCAVLAFWPEREFEQPVPIETVRDHISEPLPAVPPPHRIAAPRPVIRSRPRPNPPTVSVEFHPVPESAARKMVNRVPALPLLRRFQVKSDEDFVSPNPLREAKPAFPADLARRFPGEWRVDLRVAIDKFGQVSHVSVLGPSANSEFVNLAREAASRWEFEPARLHDRPVSGALDVMFRFHNPVR